jgi:Leucine-rich repeat (LRR) protein
LAKLNNIDVVSLLSNLQHLFIETLNGVEKFPDISNLPKLRRVMIASCKNLRDFTSIEKNQSLTDFIIQNAKNSDIHDFIPILMNPNIKELGIGYEKLSAQKEISELAAKYNKVLKTYMYPQFDGEFEYE